jgi:hypothetical protein
MRAYASILVCVCVCVRERERWGGREGETDSARARKSVCVCVSVCVRKHTVVPGFGQHEKTSVYEQLLPAELALSVIH